MTAHSRDYSGGYTNSMKWGADTAGTAAAPSPIIQSRSHWTAPTADPGRVWRCVDIANIALSHHKFSRGPDHFTRHNQLRRNRPSPRTPARRRGGKPAALLLHMTAPPFP